MKKCSNSKGIMTWQDFKQCAFEIKRKSEQIGDNWKLCGTKNDDYMQYLSKQERHVCRTTNTESELFNNDELCDESQVEYEEECVYDYEYHIVYSISYMVPVLCFNASKSDGSMLTLEEAWQILSVNGVVNENKYTVLTQMDHPVLQKPYLTIHPCHTKELLENFSKSENLLISFISALGPYIGLHSKLEYGIKNTFADKT